MTDRDRQAPQPGAVAGGYKQAPGSKNCMQSAVAYMLGLPMEAVPDFEKAGPHAWDLFEQFFDERGFSAEMFPPTVEIAGDYLASGSTERGTSHMVVMRGGELLHDPHPSNSGLTSPQAVWLIARKAGPTAAVPAPEGGPAQTFVEWSAAWINKHGYPPSAAEIYATLAARPAITHESAQPQAAVALSSGELLDLCHKHAPDCPTAQAIALARAALAAQPQVLPAALSDEMRAILTNERCVYGSADELYAALLAAAPQTKEPTNDR